MSACASASWYHQHARGRDGWFGSNALSYVLVGVLVVLLMVSIGVHASSYNNGDMHTEYKFTPRSTAAFSYWIIAALVFDSVAFLWVFASIAPSKRGCRRWMMVASCVVFTTLLIVGNTIAVTETHHREAFEQGFAVKFNGYYCNVRTVRVCLEGTEDEVLVLTRGNNLAVESSENTTDVAYSVWAQCKKMIEKYHMLGASRESEEVETYGDLPIYEFLDQCDGSHEIDAWCGDLLHRATPPTDEEHLAYPAPYASNRGVFLEYARVEEQHGVLECNSRECGWLHGARSAVCEGQLIEQRIASQSVKLW